MTYHARVTDSGEVVLPAGLARALGLQPGDQLRIEQHGGQIVLETEADAITAIQRVFRGSLKQPFTVDEFIADRRRDAARD
jgi:AbrB family looped-hinge helix DNA binding protein